MDEREELTWRSPTRVRSALTENLNLKLLSFAFALVLYSLVHGGQDAQRSVSVDLVALLPPESANRVLVSPIPPQVRVTVRGSRTTIDDLHADDIGSLQIDARAAPRPPRHVRPSRWCTCRRACTVEQFDPPASTCSGRTSSTRDVPIQVSVVGTPAPGFVVKGVPVAEPANVRVRGPKSEVMVLQHVRADAFDVTGLTEGIVPAQRSRSTRRRPACRLRARSASSVTVEITREVAERTFTKLPVVVIGHAEGQDAARRGRRAPRLPARHRPRAAPRADRPARRGELDGSERERVAPGDA